MKQFIYVIGPFLHMYKPSNPYSSFNMQA